MTLAEVSERFGAPLHRGIAPLHYQVYVALKTALDCGDWVAGQQLPTERQLSQSFGCSLITIRRALDELVREKRIVRESGRGTFATGGPVDRELASMTSFTEEMAERGMQARTAVVSARFDTPSPAAARELQLDPAAPICFIERVRFTGTEPLLLEQVQVPEWRFPGLLELDLATESLYAIFAQRYGVVLTRASETVEPALPDAREARLLGQSSRRPVLILQLTSFTASDEPIEFCRSVVRGDRARYRMDVRSARSPMSVTASDPVV